MDKHTQEVLDSSHYNSQFASDYDSIMSFWREGAAYLAGSRLHIPGKVGLGAEECLPLPFLDYHIFEICDSFHWGSIIKGIRIPPVHAGDIVQNVKFEHECRVWIVRNIAACLNAFSVEDFLRSYISQTHFQAAKSPFERNALPSSLPYLLIISRHAKHILL